MRSAWLVLAAPTSGLDVNVSARVCGGVEDSLSPPNQNFERRRHQATARVELAVP